MHGLVMRTVLCVVAVGVTLIIPVAALAASDSMVIQPTAKLATKVDLKVTIQITCPAGDTRAW